jgi:hypothetical protein
MTRRQPTGPSTLKETGSSVRLDNLCNISVSGPERQIFTGELHKWKHVSEMTVEVLKTVTFGTSHCIILPGLHFYIFILQPCPEHLLQEEYEYY